MSLLHRTLDVMVHVVVARVVRVCRVAQIAGRDRPLANGGDAGMSTAEYAVGTVAAVAFAGVLYAVVSSSATRELISSVVERALSVPI